MEVIVLHILMQWVTVSAFSIMATSLFYLLRDNIKHL